MGVSLIRITHNEPEVVFKTLVQAETGDKFLAGTKLMQYLRSLMGGSRSAKVVVAVNAAKATGTVTLASFVADDTVTVNGITFTGKASPSGAEEFACGVSDTADAAALAATLNAHTTLDGMIVATSALGVVTIEALHPGELGNALTIAISAHGSVSGARLTGGDNGAIERTHYYGSAS
jgi:phage tail sheath gpL-like